MKKGIFNRILGLLPGYGWVCLIGLIACQALVFCATRPILTHLTSVDLSTALDSAIPFRPVWITVYVLSFASWLITFFLLFRQRREHVYRNSAAYFVTLLLTFALFMLVPAAMERPEVPGRDFFSFVTRFVYVVDQPNNLFPSLHVICSYYCWRCIFDTEGIPRWYRRFNFVFLLLVCASILYVKQHVIVDIPTAVVASEVPLQLARRFRWERAGYAIEQRITKQKQ